MATVKNIKVWTKKTTSERRVYVTMSDGRQGCKYITGNKWNEKNSKTGDVTQEEWKAAWTLSELNGRWTNVWDGVPEAPRFFKQRDPEDRFASDGI